ncbi:glutaminyl-peptide cyclotransferase [Hoyosella rhizosphaerae]|uniref:Glutamine cyclotransferase n=1 Tax=Hoyosella rhizosphaerae TaxID=1755582 RepID=A0A916UHD7_9ACTN|nr:glutaminyl-peptide cyclotransferase [Hoyosella rhizosphaerae]MBN4928194.1 glutaminyl-peptide cyclotransferase [Hoyosella rhizosphaerae]GGC73113.1 glutamine cyclotransferase [Hoyosella rhizosphaerae]
MRLRQFRRAALAVSMMAPLLCAGCFDTLNSDSITTDSTTPDAPPATLDRNSITMIAEVVDRHPHSRDAFTQGLELHGDVLFESTGRVGESWIQSRAFPSGDVIAHADITDPYFGEGLTVVGDTVWHVTWKDGVAFARDRDSLEERFRVTYDGEGWGLCSYDDHEVLGAHVVMSDGTDVLTFRDPETFDVLDTVRVTLDGAPVVMLNELECTPDGVYANVWMTEKIVRIDADTGTVGDVIDASRLLTASERPGTDVLNGIAAIEGTDHFLVTGKLWPTMFEVKFVPR